PGAAATSKPSAILAANNPPRSPPAITQSRPAPANPPTSFTRQSPQTTPETSPPAPPDTKREPPPPPTPPEKPTLDTRAYWAYPGGSFHHVEDQWVQRDGKAIYKLKETARTPEWV